MRDVIVYLEDILKAIERIEKTIHGKSKNNFLSNVDIQDNILRRLEIIGEAVKHIPEKMRDESPTLPWKSIAGARDILIHAYFDIDLERIWLVVKNDLPALKKEVKKIVINMLEKE